jgi:hypothetical protein
VNFVDIVLATHRTLDAAGLAHAFGGALALNNIAEPRGTRDIDVNVFVPSADMERVADALGELGYAHAESETLPIAGVRFLHPDEPFPIDVFLSIDERYDLIQRRVERHLFGMGDDELPFLSAEDLCLFKLSFARPKDWVDLAEIVRARPSLDVAYIEEQLVGLRGPTMYPRIARLRTLFH